MKKMNLKRGNRLNGKNDMEYSKRISKQKRLTSTKAPSLPHKLDKRPIFIEVKRKIVKENRIKEENGKRQEERGSIFTRIETSLKRFSLVKKRC